MILALVLVPLCGVMAALGALIYRLGVKDGMSRANGDRALPPMLKKDEPKVLDEGEVERIMAQIDSYDGGTIGGGKR